MNCDYMCDKKGIYHKVLFIKIDVLEYFINDLYSLIKPSSDDEGFSKELLKNKNFNSERKNITKIKANRD